MKMNYIIYLVGQNGEKNHPLHSHDEYEVLYYLEGKGVLRSSNGDKPFFPGQSIIIPPGVKHGSVSEGGYLVVGITGTLENAFSLNEPVCVPDNAERDAEALVRMLLRNRNAPRDYRAALLEAYFRFLQHRLQPEDAVTQAVRKVASAFAERFYDASLSASAILRESGYAEDYIRAQFRKIYGKTPTEYLAQLRIEQALHLMEIYRGAFPLSEVAERCGFGDYVYFSKRFKAQTGISPQTYTKKISAER